VPGVLARADAAGPLAWTITLALLLAVLAGAAPLPGVRRWSALVAAPALAASIAWTLGAAAVRLLHGQPDVARVSLAAGAWILIASVGVLTLSARRLDPPAPVARRVAIAAGVLAVVGAAARGGLGSLSVAQEFAVRQATFWPLVGGHLSIAAASLAAGTALGVPLGLWAWRNTRVRDITLAITGAVQTVPSLALLGLLVVPLASLGAAFPVLRDLGIRGIGAAPGLIALTLYALLPIVRGTYVGLAGVDAAALDAGRGMGMTGAQLLARVELPLAAPLVIEGIRAAAVLIVGIATLTVFAGARTLGVLVFEGLGQFAPDLILLGALPIIVLAVLVDMSLGALAKALTPLGVRA